MSLAAIMVEKLRNIQRAVFANGLTVLTEKMDHIRSVSMGIWIKSGSRHEDPNFNGISHFLEHMVFKGTSNRSAEDIARQVDSIGGNMDAFTGKETICFNVKVLDEHLPIAVDVLSDMVLHPVFHEIFTQNFFKDHPLGKPILGTKETVRRFSQEAILDYYGGKFAPGNMIISAAGNLDHHEFVELLRERFEQLPPGTNGWHDTPPKTNSRIILRNKKSLEQVQICVGVPSYSISHDRRYVTYVLNTLLGGGMSSRLFQNVREKQGLVYSIFSELNPFRDAGMMSVYAGTSRESAGKVVKAIVNEFHQLKSTAISEEELKRAKDQLKGSLMLSLESSTARMSNLARQEMYYDHFIGMDEIINRIQAVTVEDLLKSANELFRPELIAVTVLGNLNGLKVTRDSLAC
jgi:predicted Zn-dependent peptidase